MKKETVWVGQKWKSVRNGHVVEVITVHGLDDNIVGVQVRDLTTKKLRWLTVRDSGILGYRKVE